MKTVWKYRLTYTLCLFFLSGLGLSDASLFAQSFEVLNTDVENFPQITSIVQFTSDREVLESDFEVLDDDRTSLGFVISPLNRETAPIKGRMVFFLVDASSYTTGPANVNFKKALDEAIGSYAGENDVINIGYYGEGTSASEPYRLIEPDFSNNFSLIRDRLQNRIMPSLDDSTQSNVYAALKESLDYINESPDLGLKSLILLSGAVDNRESAYRPDDIIELGLRYNIPIHSINYLIEDQSDPEIFSRISLKTQGISQNVRSRSEIKNTIGNIFDSRASNQEASMSQYAISFETLASAGVGVLQYTLVYREEPEVITNYEVSSVSRNPGSGGIFSDYGFYIIVGLGIALGIGYWYYNELQIRRAEEEEAEAELLAEQQAQKQEIEQQEQGLVQDLQDRNRRLQDQLRSKEQELAKKIEEAPTVATPQKIDMKNTMISGGGGAPVFKVAAGAYSENHPLNKPTMTIGRNPSNDIVIPEQTVSSKHATITVEKGNFFIQDLGSTNGTFVNGSRVQGKILKSGDLIKLGAAQCRFEL